MAVGHAYARRARNNIVGDGDSPDVSPAAEPPRADSAPRPMEVDSDVSSPHIGRRSSLCSENSSPATNSEDSAYDRPQGGSDDGSLPEVDDDIPDGEIPDIPEPDSSVESDDMYV